MNCHFAFEVRILSEPKLRFLSNRKVGEKSNCNKKKKPLLQICMNPVINYVVTQYIGQYFITILIKFSLLYIHSLA